MKPCPTHTRVGDQQAYEDMTGTIGVREGTPSLCSASVTSLLLAIKNRNSTKASRTQYVRLHQKSDKSG